MNRLRAIWIWVRFGSIRTEAKQTINGIACEVAYYGRFNRLVGYWAYGSFDPSLPFNGDAVARKAAP